MEVNVKYEISNDKLISILSDALGMGGAEWATLVKGYDKNNVEGEADSTNTGATNQTAAFTGLFAVAGTSLLIIMRKRKASQKEK